MIRYVHSVENLVNHYCKCFMPVKVQLLIEYFTHWYRNEN